VKTTVVGRELVDIDLERIATVPLEDNFSFGNALAGGVFQFEDSFTRELTDYGSLGPIKPIAPIWACKLNIPLTISGFMRRFFSHREPITSLPLIHTLVTNHETHLSTEKTGNLFLVRRKNGETVVVKLLKHTRFWILSAFELETDTESFPRDTVFFTHVTPATRLL
jgi:hypothetical protein